MGPPNHPFVHRVWNHYFHHPFWGGFTLIFGSTPICTQKINTVYFGKTKWDVQVYKSTEYDM